MATIVLYVAATESDASSGAADLERSGTRLSVVPAVSIETIRKRAPAADCVVFTETPTTAAGAHLLDVVDACGPTPLVLYTGSEYGPTTARATDGIDGYVRRDGDRGPIHLADEIHWVCHEPERGTAQAPIPIAPSEPDPDPASRSDPAEAADPSATARVQANRQFAAQRDRLDAIQRLLDHDVKNQLNLARGYLTIAMETNSPAHVTEVEDAHERLAESTERLLELAAQRELIAMVEPVGLQDIARRAWARLGDRSTADRTLEFADDQLLQADKERLTDALEHLFRTVDAPAARTDGSGTRDSSDSTTILVGRCPDGFFITDDSGTIPAETRPILRDTRSGAVDNRPNGLEAVRRIADAHGWSISIEESEWSDSRVEVTGAAIDGTDVRLGPLADDI